ncbi:hypothetical protein LTV02_05480 [Nocardia yamanashiensis]|uniref:hypothetical protein n=1 Tax=Nocardia yamanashiensis TaxID=209247 RepID=UPI001E62A598|nr:hypothetical protein [Nocardia yamanashiensis]UGT42853.1 hypothetical protein LTV02_05480 [Nocardia yamanashiensis]
MDLTANTHTVTASPPITVKPWVPASILFAASMTFAVGSTWDIQWHADVGPDTFFTLPHLFIYASAAIAGFVSLAVILATTAAGRAGRRVDGALGGPGIGVFGRTFTAPLGYMVAALGAASFLLYGLWDLWWHSLYGFDAVIDSPPHIGLFLSSTVISVGTVIVFAAARAHTWGRIGAVFSLAHLLTSSTVTALAVQRLGVGSVRWTVAVTAFMAVLLLLAGAAFRRFGATLTAVFASAIQGVFWWFAPWAAHVYADAVGLPLREHLRNIPTTPALIPFCLVPVGLVIDLLMRRGTPAARLLPTLAGAVGGALIAGLSPVQNIIVYDARFPAATIIIATTVAGAVLGALGGFLGWRFGAMLRLTAPTAEAHA